MSKKAVLKIMTIQSTTVLSFLFLLTIVSLLII